MKKFIPVILGGNIGSYSIARSFFEEFKVNSIVICAVETGSIRHSNFVIPVIEPKMNEAKKLIKLLNELDKKFEGEKILLGSDDPHVEVIIKIRKECSNNWIIPYVEQDTFDQGTNKRNFYDVCEKCKVPYPKTHIIEKHEDIIPKLSFDFPLVVKPGNSVSYSLLSFHGKEKVFFCDTKESFIRAIRKMRNGLYKDEIIIQEFIPGEDTNLGVLTCYYSFQTKEIQLFSSGQVIFEDPAPHSIGNHLSIRTFYNKELEENVKKIVIKLGFYGFSNFDVKYDSRTKEYKFFELNGRLGRSNYFVTASGCNISKYYVNDFINKDKMNKTNRTKEVLYTVIPKQILVKSLKNQTIKNQIHLLYKENKVFHPLNCKSDSSIHRRVYYLLYSLNYFRKIQKYKKMRNL